MSTAAATHERACVVVEPVKRRPAERDVLSDGLSSGEHRRIARATSERTFRDRAGRERRIPARGPVDRPVHARVVDRERADSGVRRGDQNHGLASAGLTRASQTIVPADATVVRIDLSARKACGRAAVLRVRSGAGRLRGAAPTAAIDKHCREQGRECRRRGRRREHAQSVSRARPRA